MLENAETGAEMNPSSELPTSESEKPSLVDIYRAAAKAHDEALAAKAAAEAEAAKPSLVEIYRAAAKAHKEALAAKAAAEIEAVGAAEPAVEAEIAEGADSAVVVKSYVKDEESEVVESAGGVEVEAEAEPAPEASAAPEAAAEVAAEPEAEIEIEVKVEAQTAPEAPKAPAMDDILAAIQQFGQQFLPEGFSMDMVQPSVREFSIPGQGDNPDTHVKLASIQLPGMGGMPEPPQMEAPVERPLDYSQLSGFDETIRAMRNLGIGMHKDPAYQELVKLLNARHGFDRAPAPDSLMFRSHAREDATRFMEATAGELDLPMVRMVMEENAAGMPSLVVMTQTGVRSPLNKHRTEFVEPAVLLIQDIDLWGLPVQADLDPEHKITVNRFIVAQMSKGAREAMSLIRSGLENPDVQVLVSTQVGTEIDPYFLTMLEPFTMIDIDLPTAGERADIWMDIMKEHPSMRHVDAPSLVRYTEGMPRYDIYMAAREALEEAYRIGLASGRYFAVSQQLVMEKLANFQPLDSQQYRDLEEAVIYDFVRHLDEVEYYINANGADW